jgi:hypothetical protein
MAKSNDDSAIALKNVFSAVDNKDTEWWETLTPAQQKKFSAWLYMRYTSNVKGNPDLARYYLRAVNERVNKKFNSVRKHNKLLYLLMTTASPDMGEQFHQFIPPLKFKKTNRKRAKLLEKLFPLANEQELEILSTANSDDDIKEYLISAGWSDKEINEFITATDTDDEE